MFIVLIIWEGAHSIFESPCMAAVFLPATTSADVVNALLHHCGIPHHMHLSSTFFRMKEERE